MTTKVPSWPALGVTVLMTPAAVYVNPLVCVVVAPDVASSTTSTLPALAFLTTTTTAVCVDDVMSAATDPSLTDTILSDWPASFPRSSLPAIVTFVPSWPFDGLVDVISLASWYVKPSALVMVAPVVDVSTTDPVATLPAAARTTTVFSSDDVVDATVTPARVTFANAPPASRLVPEMVMCIPTWPLAGTTPVILLSVYFHAAALVMVAPLSATSLTATASAVALASLATTTILSLSCDVILVAVLPSETAVTAPPPPRMRSPVMVTMVSTRPVVGLSAVMTPCCRYVHLALPVMVVPMSETMTMSLAASVLAPVAATTTSFSLVCVPPMDATLTPLSLTALMDFPPANRDVPSMVTDVPCWPCAGVTLVMVPGSR